VSAQTEAGVAEAPAEEDRLLSLTEAAAIAQVEPRTLARWADGGKVWSARPGGSGWRKYRESEVRALAPGKMLRIGEAARLLGRDVKTLVRWSDRGKLAPVRLPGGGRRFREEDVRALLGGEGGAGT
jgi:excisionase family DNA binding protein